MPLRCGLWWLLSKSQVKFLPCMFLLCVLCAYRKDADDFRPMEGCFTCSHYLRFLREMEEEEEKFFDECDRIRKYGYPKDFRESESGESES